MSGPALAATAALPRLGAAAALALATLGARLLGLLGSFALAGSLGPAALGAFATLRSLLGYGNLNHLGVLEAYRREHPRLRAAGQPRLADTVEATAHGMAWCGSLATAVVTAAAASCWAALHPTGWVAGHLGMILLMAATIVPVTLGTFWGERLGVRQQFAAVARLRAVRGVAYATALPAGALLAEGPGAAAGLFLAELAMVLLTRSASLQGEPLVAAPRPRAVAAQLVRTGLPITFAWWIVIVQDGIDRLATLSLVGPAAGGHYAVAAMLASATFLLPEAISRVLAPRLCAIDPRGSGRAAIESRLDGIAAALAVAMPIGGAVLAAGSGPFLHTFLPQYAAATEAAQLLLLACALPAMVPGCLDLLVATDRAGRMLLVGPAAVAIRAALCACGASCIGGPAGIAVGAIAANGVFLAALHGAARRPRTTRRCLGLVAPTLVVAALFLLLQAVLPEATRDWFAATLLATATAAAALLVLAVLPGHGELLRSLLGRFAR